MPTYAKETKVSSEQSIMEIKRTVQRYKAQRFMFGEESGRAVVGFEMADRRVQLFLPLPDPNDRAFTLTDQGRARAPGPRQELYEKAIRQRWRALALVVKAKLEAVDAGISTFEQEFLAHLVVPGTNETVGQRMIPQLAEAYAKGRPLSPLLPPGK